MPTSVSLHTRLVFMALYKFVFNFNLTLTKVQLQRVSNAAPLHLAKESLSKYLHL